MRLFTILAALVLLAGCGPSERDRVGATVNPTGCPLPASCLPSAALGGVDTRPADGGQRVVSAQQGVISFSGDAGAIQIGEDGGVGNMIAFVGPLVGQPSANYMAGYMLQNGTARSGANPTWLTDGLNSTFNGYASSGLGLRGSNMLTATYASFSLGVQPGNNFGIGTNVVNTSTQACGGVGVFYVAPASTAPSSNPPSGGSVQWSTTAGYNFRGSTGTITTIPP